MDYRFCLKFFLINICLITCFISNAQFTPPAFAAGSKVNVVHTWEAFVPDLDTTSFKARPFNEVKQTFVYTDGLGRQIQTVIKKGALASGSAPLDLVVADYYDELGRQQYEYLPFSANNIGGNASLNDGNFKLNPFQQQVSFLEFQNIGEKYFYATTSFDGSPLNRVTNTKLPGNKFNTDATYKGVSIEYDLNLSIENVRIWKIDFAANAVPQSSNDANGYYEAGKLLKTTTSDDKGKMIVEYRDYDGNIILKKVQDWEVGAGLDLNGHRGWLCTYYVYDDFNQLRYIIPPKAVALLDPVTNAGVTTWVIDNDIKNGLCFYNEYDERGRLITKHSPDAGEVWMVYDNRDRLVLSQDENQRNRILNGSVSPQWSFSLFDEQDRNIATGLLDGTLPRANIVSSAKLISATNADIQLFTGANEQIKAFMPVTSIFSSPAIIANTINYYDEYKADSKLYESISVGDFAVSTNPNIEAQNKSYRTIGMQTGTKIRVLDDKYFTPLASDDMFLISTNYYDDRGRLLQSINDNIRKGTDLNIMQYDWSGKLLCSNNKHRVNNSSFSGGAAVNLFNNCITITKFDFDQLGRTIKTYKLFTFNAADITIDTKYKLLSTVEYNELGYLKTKKIGNNPVTTTDPIEIQDFSYNVNGWLTGINKDYAAAGASPANDQWYRKFGFQLGYENSEAVFSKARYDGNITGVLWRSQGDNIPRKYEYDYDNVGRLTRASFSQRDNFSDVNLNATYTNNTIDLSINIGGYDLNGNMLGMVQNGIVPGTLGAVAIDNLNYLYFNKSNKLKSITDVAIRSGLLGDFKDRNTADPYDFDLNGNLIRDKNKLITNVSGSGAGITYNFLDLSQVLTVNGKSKTEYIYDAAGNKLAKKVTPVATNIPITTYFIGSYVYEGDNLQYILHEEGKLRIINSQADCSPDCPNYVNSLTINGNLLLNSSANKWGVWDYFLKDNLGNVRMVLSEESQVQQMRCSMEKDGTTSGGARAMEEESTFGQLGALNEVKLTRFPTASSGWSSNTSAYVSKLLSVVGSTTPSTVGPNALLKVMAGDVLSTSASYYYTSNNSSKNSNFFSSIANGLIAALTGSVNVASTIKDNMSSILAVNNSVNPLTNFIQTQNSPPLTTPKAYLNVIFFDEQFKFVPTNSAAMAVAPPTGNALGGYKQDNVLMGKLLAPANGYVYIYLSNESTSTTVYFDNFFVKHKRGTILEDDTYYPFGLRIAGISAKAAFKPAAKYGY